MSDTAVEAGGAGNASNHAVGAAARTASWQSKSPTVVLASASGGRLGVLRAAGIDPVVLVSGVDEDAVRAEHIDDAPGEVVTALALAKAQAVTREHQGDPVLADAVVIGGDSMLLIDGALQGKPHTRAETFRRWNKQLGRTGDLITGHAVLRICDGEIIDTATAAAAAAVTLGRPSDIELDAYIASGEPLGVAGAFTIDRLGGWFVEKIDGDPSCVIGLSLPTTRRLLATVGVRVTDLWRAPPPDAARRSDSASHSDPAGRSTDPTPRGAAGTSW